MPGSDARSRIRILVTGATGFVGKWLVRELEQAGHIALSTPHRSRLDVTNKAAVADFVAAVHPDLIAHLAAISSGPDARRDLDQALAVNEGGTRAVMEAAGSVGPRPIPVLVTSSSEVYGAPDAGNLPLREDSPLLANQPYGVAKLAQESAAREVALSLGIPLVVARAFNHTGPGQRSDFLVPALASRIARAVELRETKITAGNIDVRRDISDVRDVVCAYRLILESLLLPATPVRPKTYNVASGQARSIREIVALMAKIAGAEVQIEVDPAFVRLVDPPEIRGDATLISSRLGWQPRLPLEVTLRDVLEAARATPSVGA